jgi:hypothetical protein
MIPDSAQGGKASPNSPVGPCKKQHSEVELAEFDFLCLFFSIFSLIEAIQALN